MHDDTLRVRVPNDVVGLPTDALSFGMQVQDQVKAWNAAGHRGKKLMCTARPPWVTMSARIATFKKDCNMIKCNLRDIIWVDLEKEVRPI